MIDRVNLCLTSSIYFESSLIWSVSISIWGKGLRGLAIGIYYTVLCKYRYVYAGCSGYGKSPMNVFNNSFKPVESSQLSNRSSHPRDRTWKTMPWFEKLNSFQGALWLARMTSNHEEQVTFCLRDDLIGARKYWDANTWDVCFQACPFQAAPVYNFIIILYTGEGWKDLDSWLRFIVVGNTDAVEVIYFELLRLEAILPCPRLLQDFRSHELNSRVVHISSSNERSNICNPNPMVNAWSSFHSDTYHTWFFGQRQQKRNRLHLL